MASHVLERGTACYSWVFIYFIFWSFGFACFSKGYRYSKTQKAVYVTKKEEFEARYEEALLILSELEDAGVVNKEDLWITESEGHI